MATPPVSTAVLETNPSTAETVEVPSANSVQTAISPPDLPPPPAVSQIATTTSSDSRSSSKAGEMGSQTAQGYIQRQSAIQGGSWTPTSLQSSTKAVDMGKETAGAAKQKAEVTKPLSLTVDPTNPKAVQDIGLQVKEEQAKRARDMLQMQQQSTRQQLSQRLYEAGMSGGGMAAIMALNERDLASKMSDQIFKSATDIGEYLATKQDKKQADAQASHVATFSTLMQTNPAEAKNFAESMARMYPDEPYWSDLSNPGILDAMVKANAPQAFANRQTAINNALTALDQKGYDYQNAGDLESATGELKGYLRQVYDRDYIVSSMTTWEKTSAAQELYDAYADANGKHPSDLTESERQEIWLDNEARRHMEAKVTADITQTVANGYLDMGSDLNEDQRKTISQNLGKLAAQQGFLTVFDQMVDAEDINNGVASIFVSPWYADKDFNDLSPAEKAVNNVMDAAYLAAANQLGGDIDGGRSAFYNHFWTAAESLGVNTTDGIDSAETKRITDHIANLAKGGYIKSQDLGTVGGVSATTDSIKKFKDNISTGGITAADDLFKQWRSGDTSAMASISESLADMMASGEIKELDELSIGNATTPGYVDQMVVNMSTPEGWYVQNVGGEWVPVYLRWAEGTTKVGNRVAKQYTLTGPDGTSSPLDMLVTMTGTST